MKTEEIKAAVDAAKHRQERIQRDCSAQEQADAALIALWDAHQKLKAERNQLAAELESNYNSFCEDEFNAGEDKMQIEEIRAAVEGAKDRQTYMTFPPELLQVDAALIALYDQLQAVAVEHAETIDYYRVDDDQRGFPPVRSTSIALMDFAAILESGQGAGDV